MRLSWTTFRERAVEGGQLIATLGVERSRDSVESPTRRGFDSVGRLMLCFEIDNDVVQQSNR
jgi:hypothetical protein